MLPFERFAEVRHATEKICQGLETEDFGIQAWPFASPAKWHLGHTTWFFETFCLRAFFEEKLFDETFPGIFNSYYESQGPRIEQARRGVLSRPTVRRVFDFRAAVNERMRAAFQRIASESEERSRAFFEAVELGLHHEMQHQELLYMDLKAAFFHQPGFPALPMPGAEPKPAPETEGFVSIRPGLYDIGATESGFAFDLEKPRHRVYLEGAEISRNLVTHREYLEFIHDRGYARPELWLSAGWAWVRENRIEAPLYWVRRGDEWMEYTLSGLDWLSPERPVSHVSYYEADAFARWREMRLPTEAEWEVADQVESLQSSHWQWTSSAYLPYPGFRPLPGAFGEYNGKFMSGQMVLRGNCFATPPTDARPTSRNFFSPEMRWQFSAIRLCKELNHP